MNRIMYSAKLSHGEPSLIKITITKENLRTFNVSDKKIILGESFWQLSGLRVHKGNLDLFDTLTKASEFLIRELEDNNESLKLQIQKNKQVISELETIRLNNA